MLPSVLEKIFFWREVGNGSKQFWRFLCGESFRRLQVEKVNEAPVKNFSGEWGKMQIRFAERKTRKRFLINGLRGLSGSFLSGPARPASSNSEYAPQDMGTLRKSHPYFAFFS